MLESIPATTGQKAGYTLDRLSVYRRANTDRQLFRLTFISMESLEFERKLVFSIQREFMKSAHIKALASWWIQTQELLSVNQANANHRSISVL